MTREEEIRQAALAYSFDTDGGVTGDLNTGRDDFMKGAEWADEHPSVIWHKNIDGDLPKKSGCYLVMAKNGSFYVCKYDAGNKYWDNVGYPNDIIYWMKIPQKQ